MANILENVKIVSKTGTTSTGKPYKNLILSSDNADISARTGENGWIGNTLKITDKFKPSYSEFKQTFPGVNLPTKIASKDKNVWGWGYWINSPEDEAKKIEDIKKLAQYLNSQRSVDSTGDEDIDKFEGFEDIQAFIDRLRNMLGEINIQDEAKQREIKAGIEKFIKDLAGSVDAVAANEKLVQFFEWTQKFNTFSFNNQILIYIQKPNATQVASKTTWSKLGYQPKENAFQIFLWRPHLRPKSKEFKEKIRAAFYAKYASGGRLTPKQEKMLKDELDKPMVDTSKRPILYPTYDITDVVNEAGEPATEKAPQKPELMWSNNTPNEKADKIAEALYEVIPSYRIKLTFYKPTGGEKGYSSSGSIHLSDDLIGIAKASTVIHEFAHEIMHQSYIKNVPEYWEVEKMSEKAKMINAAYVGRDVSKILELQAEGVAYVVLRQFGIDDTQHAVNYIALWNGDNDSVMSNLSTITKTANIIINDINTHYQSNTDVEGGEDSEFGEFEPEQGGEEPVSENDQQAQSVHADLITKGDVAQLLGLDVSRFTNPIQKFNNTVSEAKQFFKTLLN
jgi:hypothetical protein